MTEVATTVPAEDGRYGHTRVPDELYHTDRSTLSCTAAKLLLPPSCPAKFREYVDNPPLPKREYDFGHVAHLMLLGTGPGLSVLDPAVHGRRKDGGIADNPAATTGWKQACLAARDAGKVPVHVDVVDTAALMVAAVHNHPEAGELFARGHPEVSMYHTDPQTGVRLRGRADWMTYRDGRLVIVDYKTARDGGANPATWARRAVDFGYHIQGAWYWTLARALDIAESPAFLFVVQEKTPPYLVSVNELDPPGFELGLTRMRQAIDIYARCSAEDRWPGYGDGINPVSLPPWAFADTAGSVADWIEQSADTDDNEGTTC